MGTLRANLERTGVPLNEIKYGLAAHYHIDHAGLAQELKQAGVPLLVLEAQVTAIPLVKSWTKPADRFVDISTHDNVTTSFSQSRAVLSRMGIEGEILHTPGHSDDRVSLLLDDGSALNCSALESGSYNAPHVLSERTASARVQHVLAGFPAMQHDCTGHRI